MITCIRGRFCELLGAGDREQLSAEEMFTLGMFSLIDAVIDQPMARAMEELPLSPTIKRALVEGKGRMAGYVALVQAYETGQWANVARLAEALRVDSVVLPALYLQACQWSDAAASAAGGKAAA